MTRVAKAVFLDRDGVVNRSEVIEGKPYAPRRLEDFQFFPNVRESVHALKEAGFVVIVVTNQPDIGNGLVDKTVVEKMNEMVVESLGVHALYMCHHRQDEGCDCRKPKPGMLVDAAQELGLELAASFMVGDRWSDIAAGQSAGCRTIFVDRGYSERLQGQPDYTVQDLGQAVQCILELERNDGNATKQ